MGKVIGFELRVTGTDTQAANVLKVEAALKKVTAARNKLIKKQSEGTELSKKEQRQLERLTREQSKLRQQKVETTKEIKRQNKEIKSVAGSYDRLVSQNAKLRKTMNALPINDTTGKLKKLQQQFAKNNQKLKSFDKNLGQSFRNVGNYGSALNGVRANFATLAVGITSAILVFNQLQRVFGSSLDIIKDFEQATADLAGKLDTTKEGVEALTDEAIRLGSITAKTATEILGLQFALAGLGFEEEQIIDLTGAIINGSIAMRAELAETGEVVGAVVNSFNDLATTDAPLIIDQLTRATQKTALTFVKLQTALPIVSKAADAAGIPFTRLVSLLGKLSDSGIDASSSATALRNIFIESAAQGLNYEQIIEKIKGSTDKLTAANDEFGKRGAISAATLADNIDKVAELDLVLQAAGGTAQRVADTQLNTLNGRLDLLSSAWEGFVLSVDRGDGVISKAFKAIVENATKTVSELTEIVNGGLIREGTVQSRFDEAAVEAAKKKALEIAAISAEAVDQEIEATKARISKVTKLLDDESAFRRATARQALVVNRLLLQELNTLTDAEINASEAANEFSNSLGSSSFGGKAAELTARNINRINEELKEQRRLLFSSALGSDAFGKAQQNIIELEKELDAALGKTNKTLKKREEEIKRLSSKTFRDIQNERIAIIEEREKVESEVNAMIDNLLNSEATDRRVAEFEKIQDEEAANTEARIAAAKDEQRRKDLIRDVSIDTARQLAVDATSFIANQNDIRAKSQIAAQRLLLDQGSITEEEFQKKRSQILRRQAESEKQLALFNIVISTAAAILKAAPVVPLQIATGILGASQLALVASQPIPQFLEKGGVIKGRSHAAGGIDIGNGNEVEGNEIWLTKGVYNNPTLRQMASDINVAGGGRKLASGGIVTASNVAPSVSSLVSKTTSANDIANQLGAIINDKRVVVVESDITSTQDTVQVNESLGEF